MSDFITLCVACGHDNTPLPWKRERCEKCHHNFAHAKKRHASARGTTPAFKANTSKMSSGYKRLRQGSNAHSVARLLTTEGKA